MDFSSLKRLSFKHKNNKFFFYIAGYSRLVVPNWLFRLRLDKELLKIKQYDADYINGRVEYYNRLDSSYVMPQNGDRLSNFRLGKRLKTYFFDAYRYSRFFNSRLGVHFLFGDIDYVPEKPSIVKSRPICDNNANAVIIKLDSIRHFIFTHDKKTFESKKDMLVGRAKVAQIHRVKFLEMYFNNPLCNIGQVKKGGMCQEFLVPRMTITEHLDYKFILCLEGFDVASNLKWVMSSNSIAVMPKPKFETWFMEGTLVPDYHYIIIKDDYSDLEERLTYYITHTDEAKQIIEHAHQYIEPFKNKKMEKLISLLVLQKYFKKTGQL
ncbi:MAG: glycosyl transferase family 90 [Bacteroidales bacterium]|nr:glycosyl transferase family 90 [Bacteroidales bacterium]MDD4713798.1 glycosyl transferase family 90 [Bacteroidales bacterium]